MNGGPLTFRTAAARPDRIGAAATFHRGGLVTDKPSSPNLLIPNMKAAFYCAVVANDDGKDPAAKAVLRENFAKAQLPAEVVVTKAPTTAGAWLAAPPTTPRPPNAPGRS